MLIVPHGQFCRIWKHGQYPVHKLVKTEIWMGMYCKNKIVYTVQDGDTLYQLSRTYHTTVTELILGNPGVNPYNLQAGMKLDICPGEGYVSMQEERPQQEDAVSALRDAMRLAWLDMIFWNQMFIMGIDEQPEGEQAKALQAKALQALEERLHETADEIVDVFAGHWPAGALRELRDILSEHLELTGELARTLKSGNMENYDAIIKGWYANASRLAELLGKQNPYFGGRETNNMLFRCLDMTREMMEHQFNGEYAQSIQTHGDVKKQTLELADHLSQGLLAR